MVSRWTWLVSLLTVLCAALPVGAEITVHFATVFATAGNEVQEVQGVWLVGVDCGDGVVKGAGVCSDEPAECAKTAAEAICNASTTASPSTTGSTDVTTEPRIETHTSLLREVPPGTPEWMRRLGPRMEPLTLSQRASTVSELSRQMGDVVRDCDLLCYWWGEGCPCWTGEEDWLGEPDPIFPVLLGIAAGVAFDVVQCGIRIEIDAAEKGVEDPLDGPDGLKRLTDCAFGSVGSSTVETPGEHWTEWLDRDDPSGSGDYELLAEFVKAGSACPDPSAIQCQTLDGRDWTETGQEVTCNVAQGGACRNDDQECLDYRVRFRCPD